VKVVIVNTGTARINAHIWYGPVGGAPLATAALDPGQSYTTQTPANPPSIEVTTDNGLNQTCTYHLLP
jgi:hypothetical protein